jgi:hypothetical protein
MSPRTDGTHPLLKRPSSLVARRQAKGEMGAAEVYTEYMLLDDDNDDDGSIIIRIYLLLTYVSLLDFIIVNLTSVSASGNIIK